VLGLTPLKPGDVIYGVGLGEIVESNNPAYKVGEIVALETGWQQYVVAEGPREQARKIKPEVPFAAYLGVIGVPGLTAWGGVEKVAPPRLGETFVVSAASGPTGGTAGQLAKAKGARVIGIAGSEQKCRIATEKFGFDACINYKTENWTQALEAACPEGIHVYFDNVSGPLLDAILPLLADYGRIAMCGFMSQYNRIDAWMGHDFGMFLAKRAIVRGVMGNAYFDQWDEFTRVATHLYKDGRLVPYDDCVQGLEHAPAHFVKLMKGENTGKALVAVAPEKV
jgi:NADPH-dependent curcumin reductase CurA